LGRLEAHGKEPLPFAGLVEHFAVYMREQRGFVRPSSVTDAGAPRSSLASILHRFRVFSIFAFGALPQLGA
jgi:hypothetical protein